jgi:hypothetical protein
MKRILHLIALAFAAFSFGACTHVREASHDAVAWVRGALKTSVDAPLERTVKATTKALHSLKFSGVATRDDALSGVVTATTAQEDKIEVTLTRISNVQTHVDIRVGTFGGNAVSLRILSEIQQELRK